MNEFTQSAGTPDIEAIAAAEIIAAADALKKDEIPGEHPLVEGEVFVQSEEIIN